MARTPASSATGTGTQKSRWVQTGSDLVTTRRPRAAASAVT